MTGVCFLLSTFNLIVVKPWFSDFRDAFHDTCLSFDSPNPGNGHITHLSQATAFAWELVQAAASFQSVSCYILGLPNMFPKKRCIPELQGGRHSWWLFVSEQHLSIVAKPDADSNLHIEYESMPGIKVKAVPTSHLCDGVQTTRCTSPTEEQFAVYRRSSTKANHKRMDSVLLPVPPGSAERMEVPHLLLLTMWRSSVPMPDGDCHDVCTLHRGPLKVALVVAISCS